MIMCFLFHIYSNRSCFCLKISIYIYNIDIYIYTYIYIYIYIYTWTNLPVNSIVRVPHIWSTYSQKMFLAHSTDKQTQKYDSESSQHYPPINTKVKGIEPYQDELVSYIHTNLPVNAMVRLPNSQSGDIQVQERFLAPSPEKKTRIYDTEIYARYHKHSRQRVPNSFYFMKIALFCLAPPPFPPSTFFQILPIPLPFI